MTEARELIQYITAGRYEKIIFSGSDMLLIYIISDSAYISMDFYAINLLFIVYGIIINVCFCRKTDNFETEQS